MRRNLDYSDPDTGAVTHATFAGWGLCRGLEAFLDIKEPGSREYQNAPLAVAPDGTCAPYISPACIATGDWRHANLYAVYLVHRLAALHALCNLPRYLASALPFHRRRPHTIALADMALQRVVGAQLHRTWYKST